MPVLYLVGIAYCAGAYWVDKWCLLRSARKPPGYTEDIIVTAMLLLPAAGFLHAALTLWMYGQQAIFPSGWGNLLPLFEEVLGMTTEQYDEVMNLYLTVSVDVQREYFRDYVRARCLDFARQSSWLLVVIVVVFLVYYLLSITWSLWFRPICTSFELMANEFARKRAVSRGV